MMAVYRCEFKIISRGKGHSAMAAAAYRAAEDLHCEREDERYDYTRKTSVVTSFIHAPDPAPDWMQDREQLWNAVEKSEKRKDARLAREVVLSLPHELSDEQRIALVSSFVEKQFVSQGMVADVAIHRPHYKGDYRNHHAHVLLTTREATEDGFAAKKNRLWNSKAFLTTTREAWAVEQNRVFEQLKLDVRVDHRSLKAQGINREPEPKLGKHASQCLKIGHYENASFLINRYFEALNRNQERAELEHQKHLVDMAIARIERGGSYQEKQEATLLACHSYENRAIEEQQHSEIKQMEIRLANEAKVLYHKQCQEADSAAQAARPSWLKRAYEVLTLQAKSANEKRQNDHEQEKRKALDNLRQFKLDNQLTLDQVRAQHSEARNMLRKAHQLERDVLRGKVDVEQAINPPQKYYQAMPAVSVGGRAPALVPQFTPKPPRAYVNMIKGRTRARLIQLEAQDKAVEQTITPSRQPGVSQEKSHWSEKTVKDKTTEPFKKSNDNQELNQEKLQPEKPEKKKTRSRRNTKQKAPAKLTKAEKLKRAIARKKARDKHRERSRERDELER